MNSATTQRLGVFDGISNDDYHAGPGVSCSMLHTMAKSPAHCYALNFAADRPERIATPAMLAGTLAHCAILEPDKLDVRYVVRPTGLDSRTKDGKTWAASVPAGATIISSDQMLTAQRQRDAVLSLPEFAAHLFVFKAEQSAFWIDDETGLLCRCRPDAVNSSPSDVTLIDVKTCADVCEDAFARSIGTYGYHRQAAWYTRGYERASGRRVAGFIFAAVTNAYPFIAKPYILDADSLAQGDDENAELLARYAECLKTGQWPAYVGGYQSIALPRYMQRREELEISYE